MQIIVISECSISNFEEYPVTGEIINDSDDGITEKTRDELVNARTPTIPSLEVENSQQINIDELHQVVESPTTALEALNQLLQNEQR